MKIAIFASTRGTVLPEIFELHHDASNSIELVFFTNKEVCEARKKAETSGIPVFFVNPEKAEISGKIVKKTREEYDFEVVKILESEKIDFIFLIGYMRIISGLFVSAYSQKILNIHPSLLPAFAGGMDNDVHSAVLKAGCKISGATLHYVTEEVDAGEIFAQKSCKISEDETPETLKVKVQKLEKEMIREAMLGLTR